MKTSTKYPSFKSSAPTWYPEDKKPIFNRQKRKAEMVKTDYLERLPDAELFTLEAQLEAGVNLEMVNPQVMCQNPVDFVNEMQNDLLNNSINIKEN